MIQSRLDKMGVNLKAGEDFEVVNPESDDRYAEYWGAYHELKKREADAKTDADERLKQVLAAEKERRDAEKEMLREMVERGHEATQALEGSNKAIDAFKTALDGYTRRLDELDRSQEKRFDELLRAISQRGNA